MLSKALQGPMIDFHYLILIYTGRCSHSAFSAHLLRSAFISVFLVFVLSRLSLCFAPLSLAVSHVDSSHVAGGGDEVEETYARLQQTDHSANSQQPLQPHWTERERSRSKTHDARSILVK